MKKVEAKQVIVIRKDLNMRKGKIAAQAAHASLKIILDMMEHRRHGLVTRWALYVAEDTPLAEWLNGRFTKICVSVDSEQELLDIYNKALNAKLSVALITDAGLTEFNNVPTKTCIAIGPDWPDKIDAITGHLKLL